MSSSNTMNAERQQGEMPYPWGEWRAQEGNTHAEKMFSLLEEVVIDFEVITGIVGGLVCGLRRSAHVDDDLLEGFNKALTQMRVYSILARDEFDALYWEGREDERDG